MTTVALVAAKDAAESVGTTVAALASLRGVDEVVVVDDGSDDATASVARAAGATVVELAANVGKGAALRAGVEATPHAHRYLLADADLGATATGLQPLLDALDETPDGLVIGVLPSAGSKAGFGAVKRLAAAGIRRACGVAVAAPLSGQRAVAAAALRRVAFAGRFGVEVGMTIDLVRAGLEVREVPVAVDHRHTGRSLRGFVHRGRQGGDVLVALATRIGTSTQRGVAVAVAALLVFGLLGATHLATRAPAGASLPTTERVLLFAFDHLSLADLRRDDLPGLRALRQRGYSAALNVRTTDRRSLDRRGGSEQPSVADAYASLGASARVRSVAELAGATADDPAALADGMRLARAQAKRDHAASLPGAFGDALHRAGKRTAFVGGAETVGPAGRAGFPGAAAVADSRGRIDVVDAGASLFEAAPSPLRVQANVTAFAVAAGRAMRNADVTLVDPGETSRAHYLGGSRADALARTDSILRAVVGAAAPDTTVVVFSPTPAGDDWALTPIVVSSSRGSGTVVSPSTHRESLAVLSDLAPTALHVLGAERSADMTGAALRVTGARFDVAASERAERDGAVRARFFLPAAVAYTVAVIVFYLVLIGALVVGAARAWRTPLRVGASAAASFPLAILFTGAVQRWSGTGGESPLLLVAFCVAAGALAALVWRGAGPAFVLAGVAVAVIAFDVAAGGPIHTSSILGYSLQTTGRFYGLPNASFSIFGAGALLVAAGVGAPLGTAVIALSVAFVAAPSLGADFGGTLAFAPVGVAAIWALWRWPVSRRSVALGAAAVVLGLAVAVGASAALGGDTHVGRAAGGGGFGNTLAHRVDANLGLLVDQWWGFLVIALALFGIVAFTRGYFGSVFPSDSALRPIGVSIMVLSLLAFAANDSGPVVAVLCLVVLAPALALRAIEIDPRRRSRR